MCFTISRFYSLDVSKSLVWNLQNKVIVENPIIYIVFDEHADFFSNGKLIIIEFNAVLLLTKSNYHYFVDSESGQEHIGFSTVKEVIISLSIPKLGIYN